MLNMLTKRLKKRLKNKKKKKGRNYFAQYISQWQLMSKQEGLSGVYVCNYPANTPLNYYRLFIRQPE